MISFSKIENAYGIKKLDNIDKLNNKKVLIYAPNGSLKTSFADFMMNLRNGDETIDVFNGLNCSYVIDNNGIILNENNKIRNENIIVFSKPDIDRVFSNNEYSTLAISNELKKELEKNRNEYSEVFNELNKICYKNIQSKNKKSEAYNDLNRIFESDDIKDSFEDMLNNYNVETNLFDKVSYDSICSDKLNKLLDDEQLKDEINTYNSIVESKKRTDIFNNGFNYSDLEKIYNTFKNTKYFEAGHSLTISGNIYNNLNSLDKLMGDLLQEIYSTNEVKLQFEKISKTLNSNKSTKEFYELIKSNPKILSYSSDIRKIQKAYCRTRVCGLETIIKSYIDQLNEIKDNLSLIYKKIDEEKTKWSDLIRKFKSRFNVNNFDVYLKNKSIGNDNVPEIVLSTNKKGEPLNDVQKRRYSTGEQRAILILNLMFEIECVKEKYDEYTLVLDDIADSFDYKNKYGILKYINEMIFEEEYNGLQLIILTHNFDFFRALAQQNEGMIKKFSAKRTKDKVMLKKAENDDLYKISFVRKWIMELRTNKSYVDFLAVLPLLRSELSILEGTKKDEETLYNEINKYVHYNKDGFDSSKIKDRKNIFEPFFKIEELSAAYSELNYQEILEEAKKEVMKRKSVSEMDLKYKMAISVLLRLEYEKFIYEKDKRLKTFEDEKIRDKYNKIKSSLEYEEVENCEFVQTIIQSFLHSNEFNFESLIDNEVDKMKRCLDYFMSVKK